MTSFTWVPFYKELAEKLLGYRERQGELIALLKVLKDQGVPVIKLTDKVTKSKTAPLAAIDPFTFFSAFNRKAKEKNRHAILATIKDRLQVQAAIPSDFDGIPIMHPMMSRFLPWQYEQKPDDVASLWALAEAILAGPPASVTPALFDRCLKIKCTKVPNLTMGLFWMRPDIYLALDKRNRALLDKRGVEHKVTDWASYLEFMEKARPLVPETPFEFSRAAYVGESSSNYWVFQCNPKVYDLAGALKAGVVTGWQVNQHKNEIRSGDKVIVWLTGDDGGCYALGTVTSQAKPFTEDIREAPFYRTPQKERAYDGVDLRIDMPLWEHPVTKPEIMGRPGFRHFPAGRQGTNFPASKAHYDGILALANRRIEMRFWKISHGKADFTAAQRQAYLQERTIHVHKNTKKGQGAQFAREMKEGDLFYLCHGNDDGIRVFARVAGPAASSPHGDGWLKRPYQVVFEGLKPERKYHGVKKGWTPNYNSTCMEIPEQELTVFESEILKPFFGKTLADIPGFGSGVTAGEVAAATNVILYGPPGTGKTYISLERAVERATGNRIGDLTSARRQLDELRGKGRIEFVTFHQSYSYEDFVEGIRPTLDGDGAAIRYECSDGIFKTLALRALYDCLEPREAATTGEFDARWQALVAQIGAEPEHEYDSISGNSKYRLAVSSRGNVNATNTKDPDVSRLTFSRANLLKVFAAHGKKASISTTDIQGTLGVGSHSSLGAVLFRELQKEQPEPGKPKQPALASDEERCDAALAFLNDREASQYRLRSSGPVTQYVMVIDEINRGNISKIFGELITLIEADKRIGAQSEMRVLLPYSKKLFGVPRNLHLLGTMNTADKSIALVDVALRRRFEFEELMPRYDLVPEFVRDVLKEMNRRITLRKDRDHQIGHACFMRTADVNAVFMAKVLPLLQEYFYNDWEGLRYVLGEKDDNGDFIVRIPVKPNEPKPRHAWQWCFDAGVKRDGFDATALLKKHYE